MSNFRTFFARRYLQFKHRLNQIRDTPHAVAGGVAIGVFFGFTPFLGLKTLLAVLIAWLFRWSKLSAALAVTFHDIILPLMPLILRWQYQIGYYIITHPHQLPPKFSPKHFHFETYFTAKSLHFLWPTFVGSLFFGAPIGLAMYFIVLEILKRGAAARARHAQPKPNQ
jgi:uncharacterized protein